MADPDPHSLLHPPSRRNNHLNLQTTACGDEERGLPEDEGGAATVPEVGMAFANHHEITLFYQRYARRVGFTVSVRRSSFTKDGDHCLYLELMCSKGGRRRPEPKFRRRSVSTTGCSARLRAKLWSDGLLHVELSVLDHNHPLSPSFAVHLRRGLRLSSSSSSTAATTFDSFSGLADVLFAPAPTVTCNPSRPLQLSDGDADAIRIFLTRMQASNPNFFYSMDFTNDGRLRNAFWSDARSRAAYSYFSDAVLIDTFSICNNYISPVAAFVGNNHHYQPVLLGCALLADETAETYSWMLKAWLACMSGRLPKAIITDQCGGLQRAVSEVLPGVRHRLCLFQIMRRFPEKLGGLEEYRTINKQLQKAVYDYLRVEEFEDEWRRLIEVHGLQGNEWLRSLYESRLSWVPAYLKDTFWAGLSCVQKNETLFPFFDGYLESNTSIKQFLSKYDMAMRSKYEKEAQGDFETFHKRRPAVSKFIMEEQLSKVYTLNVFKNFQEEIQAMMYCHASLLKMEGSISTFNVKECVFMEDGRKSMSRNYSVLFNGGDKNVECICGSFQFRGILCRHALTVFKMQQVHEIPTQFVLDRWKKDFKRLHAAACLSHNMVANNRMERYDYLANRCLQLVEVGVISDKYQLALKLIKEAEKFLLNENTYDDTVPNIVPSASKTNQLDNSSNQNGLQTEHSEFYLETDDELKGGQLEHGKETQASQALSKYANPGYTFQAVSTLPQPQPHEGTLRPHVPFACHYRPASSHPYPVRNPSGHQASGIVYMFPSGVNPQPGGSSPPMPLTYQMFQVGQPPPWRTKERAVKASKRTMCPSSKGRKSPKNAAEPPASFADGASA